jgi:two-component SAPR family response regulator
VLQRYLGDLPDEIVEQYPELLLQHGNVLWRLGWGGTAVSRYEDAQKAFAAQGDSAGVCRVLTQMAELARSQGAYRRAQQLAAEALAIVPAADHAHRAKALMALAKSEGFLTGMDRGHELGVEAVAAARLAEGALSRRARANLLRSLGHICWWYGDPEATLRYCQEALTLVSAESPIAASVYITMATPYVYRQDFETARQYAERGLAIAEQLQLPELLPRAHSNLGGLLSRGGDMAGGERHLRQAVELAQGLGLESYARVMAVGYLAQNLCGQGRVDEARQLAEAILWERAANANTYEMVVTRSVLADVALESDDLDEAQAIFESLEEIGERRQFRLPLAMVYFGLAYTHGRKGHTETAVRYAQKSVAILEPLNTWQLFLDQGERAREVCRILVEAGEKTPFVDEVLRRLPGNVAVEAGAGETAVSVQCLGQLRVAINGSEITQAQWVSTKARDMLAYFVTFRHKRIPLEKAAADIWPEQDQPGRAFHSALYRLRHALRRGSEKTKFINVKSGEYWLDGSQFRIDVDEFETAVSQAARSPQAEAAQWRQKAIALYGGEYLSNLLYYDWLEGERRRLEEMFLQILTAAAADEAQAGNYPAALGLLDRAMRRDPLRENLYCQAMEYYTAVGDRSGLIRCYRRLAQELAEAFDLPPSPHTQQQYRQLIANL